MSNHMTTTQNNYPSVWEGSENLRQIKQIYAPKLSELEFVAYCEMGKATKLNPFLREIWAVKYDERAPAQIFIGRDGYRKSAQAHPLYDYHIVEAIYTGDDFEVKNGMINHGYAMTNRGELIAAYCIVQRKGSSHYTYNIVRLEEYSTGKSLWATKKETMLKKVAEAQALKAAFQELFAGTYHEDEAWEHVEKPKRSDAANRVNDLLANKDIDSQPVTIDNEQFVNAEQLTEIHRLLDEKMFDEDRTIKGLEYFQVERLEELSFSQANEFVSILNKASKVA